jgi:tetratricopeptide (TPR) repeat protein
MAACALCRSSNTGLLDEAISLYAAALDIDGCKEKDRAHYGLGALYLLRQDVARAGDELRAAVEANGKLKEARVELANVLLAEGNVGGAVHHLQAALDIDPHYGAARSNLQQVLASQRSAAGTPPAADGGAAASLTHAAAQNEVDARREEDAFNAAFAAFDVETKDALRTVGEAELAGRRGEIQRALAGYANALPVIAKVAGAYPKLQEGLGAAYWNQVRGSSSVCWCSSPVCGASLTPCVFGVLLAGHDAAAQRRVVSSPRGARAVVPHAVVPRSAAAHATPRGARLLQRRRRARVHRRRARRRGVLRGGRAAADAGGQWHAALHARHAAHSRGRPGPRAGVLPPRPRGERAYTASSSQSLRGAHAVGGECAQIEPFLAPALFNAGNVHLRKHSLSGDPAHLHKAVDFCERALAVDDKSFHALVFMGEAQLRLGHEAAGLAALHRALTLMPNFTTAHSVLGAHFAAKNRLAEVPVLGVMPAGVSAVAAVAQRCAVCDTCRRRCTTCASRRQRPRASSRTWPSATTRCLLCV